jgi:disulfide bond formation protein DsbB
MDFQTANLIYGLLAIVGLVILAWLAVLAIAARFSETAADGLDSLRERLAPGAVAAAAIVAALAMAGSLYYSEVVHLVPCALCWFQRICMYPLVLLLGIAAFRRDIGIRVYAIPLAAIGAVISVYHLLLEWKILEVSLVCEVDNPCSSVLFRQFGFISLPFLALTAFLLVIAFLLIPERRRADKTAQGHSFGASVDEREA